MTTVYFLWHDYVLNECDEMKLLGVFTERRLAEEAQGRLVLQPGFRDHPDDFEILEYSLNKEEWSEGFVTERW